MQIDVKDVATGIVVTLITSSIIWIVTSIQQLDKDLAIIQTKLDVVNFILQDIYESKKIK
jgi:hypothetical protein